jgi:hypothetical protein
MNDAAVAAYSVDRWPSPQPLPGAEEYVIETPTQHRSQLEPIAKVAEIKRRCRGQRRFNSALSIGARQSVI